MKERWIDGTIKPENEKPTVVKPTTLKLPFISITNNKTKTLTIHLEAPRVNKFIGISSKFKIGLMTMFKTDKERADQKRTK